MKQWITDTFGSRRGFMLTSWHWILYLLGRYREYRDIDWNSVDRLVFVCKGNICRSAFAEAVARSSGIDSISCGIETVTGASANDRAIDAAVKNNIDLSEHKTTPIQSVRFRKGDLLIAMEPLQLQYLQREFDNGYITTLLGLWGKPVKPHIHDPYDASGKYFESCFNYIENSVHAITSKINNRH